MTYNYDIVQGHMRIQERQLDKIYARHPEVHHNACINTAIWPDLEPDAHPEAYMTNKRKRNSDGTLSSPVVYKRFKINNTQCSNNVSATPLHLINKTRKLHTTNSWLLRSLTHSADDTYLLLELSISPFFQNEGELEMPDINKVLVWHRANVCDVLPRLPAILVIKDAAKLPVITARHVEHVEMLLTQAYSRGLPSLRYVVWEHITSAVKSFIEEQHVTKAINHSHLF